LNIATKATMSVEEAGQRLGISRCLAYNLAKSGDLPTLRLGRRYVVPVAAFDAWLASAGSHAA